MYKVEDIKIIPYVRFQTPDGALHETMDKALAHRPPHCKPGDFAIWCFSEGKYKSCEDLCASTLVFIPDKEGAYKFDKMCAQEETSSDGVFDPGWYVWLYPEEQWTPIPDNVGEILVKM